MRQRTLTCLGLLSCAVVLGGCGGSETLTVTQTETAVRTETVVETETVKEAAPTAVFVPESGGRLLFKPELIITGVSGGAIIFDEWTGYGDPVATAKARFEVKECEPNCAAGTVSYVNTTVRLSPVVACRDTPIYETLTVVEADDPEWIGTAVELDALCREGQAP